jgi:TatD DNase family protein
MEMNDTHEASSPPAMIDTHCHLDDPSFAEDLDEVLAASRRAGVTRWILIGYAPGRWDDVAAMADGIAGMAYTLGVHPSHAQEWTPEIETRLRGALAESSAVAVGEFGLDFYRDNAPFEVQKTAMVGQLRIARDLGLPAIFHMRDAEEEMLKILDEQEALPRMVFHSFDGSARLTDWILEHEAWVGVGGLATRQKSEGLREELRRIPLDRLVLETDSPYLVPARQKDRRNVPAHVRTVAGLLAELFDMTLDDIAHATTRNAEDLFGRLQP